MENRIKQVMASVFNVDASSIDETASPETIAEWDSLKHMNLVLALEEEFSVSFSSDQIVEMLNYRLVKITVEEALKSRSGSE
jgi:acyl carrier protein